MRDNIKRKMDEHIKQILGKPALSNEDYALMREKLSQLPAENGSGNGWYWPALLMMLAMFGGQKNEL